MKNSGYPTPSIIAEEMSDAGIPTEATTDQELIRRAIMAEHDAVNLYNQIANTSNDKKVREVMLHISQEEKVHVGELQQLLDSIDPENAESLQQGRDEVG